MLGREKYISHKKGGGQSCDDAWTGAPTIVQAAATAKLSLREPDMDLMPEAIFIKRFNQKPQQLRLPVIQLSRLNGPPVRGILFHATNWNPPPGCLRVLRAKYCFLCEVRPKRQSSVCI